jgi:hypothetical protein
MAKITKIIKIIDNSSITHIEQFLPCEKSGCSGVMEIKLIDLDERYILYVCEACTTAIMRYF